MTDHLDLDAFVEAERLQELASQPGIAGRRARYNARRNDNSNMCPNGHEYTAENTLYEAGKNRRRRCLTCHTAVKLITEPTARPGLHEAPRMLITMKPLPTGRDYE